MSLKDTDVKTPGNKSIEKKWGLSSKKVKALIDRGANHEKEHNTNIEKAKQVARDHIGERPDYYKMLSKAEKMDKNKMDEACWKGYSAKGMKKKGNRMVPNCVPVEEEQIDELSNKLMHKYMKRAKGELNARDYVTRSGGDYVKKPDMFQNGPASPHDKEVTDQYPKIHKRQRGMERATALMNIREVKTYGRVRRPGWKPSNDPTPKTNPEPQKASPAMQNAFDRISAAFPKGSIKVGGSKSVKENALDEIANTPKGQSTLVKYVRGAVNDLHNTGLMQGYDSGVNPRPNGGETETRKMTKRIAKNRKTGIERAVKRMNPGLKEQSMSDIEEATRGDNYIGTVNVGDYDSENKMKRHKDTVKDYNKANGTAFRVTKHGRLGKNNPAAEKYKKTSLGYGRNRTIRDADAERHDYYINSKQWDRRKGKDTGSRHIHNIKASLKEEIMEKEDMVAEAINNILEGNLEQMRQNLYDVLQETAIEKLEERKKEIASNYFAQD